MPAHAGRPSVIPNDKGNMYHHVPTSAFLLSFLVACLPFTGGDDVGDPTGGGTVVDLGTETEVGSTSGESTASPPTTTDAPTSGGTTGAPSCASCEVLADACEASGVSEFVCQRMDDVGCAEDPCMACDFLVQQCEADPDCDVEQVTKLCAEALADCDCDRDGDGGAGEGPSIAPAPEPDDGYAEGGGSGESSESGAPDHG